MNTDQYRVIKYFHNVNRDFVKIGQYLRSLFFFITRNTYNSLNSNSLISNSLNSNCLNSNSHNSNSHNSNSHNSNAYISSAYNSKALDQNLYRSKLV